MTIRRPAFWLAVAATVLLALALSVLPWFRSGGSSFFHGAGSPTFLGLRDDLERVQYGAQVMRWDDEIAVGISDAYFNWLGWLLTGLSFAGAVAALASRRRSVAAVAVVVAVTALGFTLWALNLVSYSGRPAERIDGGPPGYADYLGHTWLGAWAALVGFVLFGVASLLVLVGAGRTATTRAAS